MRQKPLPLDYWTWTHQQGSWAIEFTGPGLLHPSFTATRVWVAMADGFRPAGLMMNGDSAPAYVVSAVLHANGIL